jgi:hypothetical protein
LNFPPRSQKDFACHALELCLNDDDHRVRICQKERFFHPISANASYFIEVFSLVALWGKMRHFFKNYIKIV